MNIIDIILLAILAIAFISGMQKGFLTSLLATFALVGAWVAALSLYSTLAANFMASQFYEWLKINVSFDSLISPLGITKTLCANVAGQAESIRNTLVSGGVPEMVADVFRDNIGAYGSLTVSQYLSQTVWQCVFNVVSFVIVFGLAYAALLLVVNLFNNMFRIPKLRGVDALLGGLLGAVRGYVLLCLIMTVLPMAFTALDSSVIRALFDGSSVGAFFLNQESALSDVFNVSGQLAKIIGRL